MTVEPGWVPPGIDTTKANVARVYDYWLGGTTTSRPTGTWLARSSP
jgi:hypothetical protein